MEKIYRIGVDAGGTKVAYGLFNVDGKLVARLQHPTDMHANGPMFTDTILANIHTLLDRNDVALSALEGVGICMPSYILFDAGHVYMTSAMPAIRDFPMRSYLEERLPVKVVLDNDSNAAAIAEYRYGAGRGSRHMVYMATGTGIGSGIIIDGKLFRGSYGWAGECGHMLATPDAGLHCGCENQGCFMSYASGRYIPSQIALRLQAGTKSVLSKHAELDGTHLLEAYHTGDRLATDIVGDVARWLAVCVYNVYQLLNINLFVFGGGLVNFGDALFGPMRSEFDRYNHLPQPVAFCFAELEEDFGIIGAAELVRESI